MNNCIGKRNMKAFVLFLFTSFVYAFLVLSSGIAFIVSLIGNDYIDNI